MWKIGQAVTKRLWNRLELETMDRAPITLDDKVVLVEDIQRVLQRGMSYREYVSVTGIGVKSTTPVPSKDLWHLDGFSLTKSGGTFTFGNIGIARKDIDGVIRVIYLSRSTGLTTYDTGIIGTSSYEMPPGSYIVATVDSHSANGNIDCIVHYRKETLY